MTKYILHCLYLQNVVERDVGRNVGVVSDESHIFLAANTGVVPEDQQSL